MRQGPIILPQIDANVKSYFLQTTYGDDCDGGCCMNGNPNEQVVIDTALLARLLAQQFPQWAELSVVPVIPGGNDNRTFRLGEAMAVRIPSGPAYAEHVSLEFEWLPKLAPYLPLPIPRPLALGKPMDVLPWPWLINPWLQGEAAAGVHVADWNRFARDLAGFLNALQDIDATGGPPPGEHNFFRGGSLSMYDQQTRNCIDALREEIDVFRATEVWEEALRSTWQRPPVWVHGDIAPDNLLIENGKLCAVIDFGQMAVGDPACDLTIAWTLLLGDARETFRQELPLDAATWSRARGWGLWKALLTLRKHRATNSATASMQRRIIEDILTE